MIRPMLEQRKRIEIRWRDLDGFGHVNNAVFLTYLEECRDEFLRRHLHDPPERGEYMLVRIAIDYRSQITMADDFVEAEVGITRVGRSSVTLGERIFAGPERRLAARGRGGRRALRLGDGRLATDRRSGRGDPRREHGGHAGTGRVGRGKRREPLRAPVGVEREERVAGAGRGRRRRPRRR